MEIWWTYPDAGRSGCSSEGTGDSLQVSFKSQQGRWHIAKTIASGVGMTNDWLATQGAMSQKRPQRPLAESGLAPLTRCQSSMEQQRSRRSWSTFRVASTYRSKSVSVDEVSVAKWTFSLAASVSYFGFSLSAFAWFPRAGGFQIVSAMTHIWLGKSHQHKHGLATIRR
jgi:hypothetical protein